MDIVEDNSKKYEELSVKNNRHYAKIIESIAVVKQFITKNKLILYGGTAIDYALKLKGDSIYSDEAIPDLDFYSYDNVKHAYELADILYRLGNEEVRTIRALYVQTMRVDLIDNNFIADVTYVPKNIFDTLPTLTYDGMKIIHPTFQKIDLHRSLSFPFEYSPNEVIFARWKKDITRFNKLHRAYPHKISNNKFKTQKQRISKKYYINAKQENTKYVVGGFAAYALLYKDLMHMMDAFAAPKQSTKLQTIFKKIIPLDIEYKNEELIFDAPTGEIELFIEEYPDSSLDFFSKEALQENRLSGKLSKGKKNAKQEKYHAYMSIMPKSFVLDGNIRTYITKNKLLSISKSTINKVDIVHLNIQPLLFTLLFNAHKSTEQSDIYYMFYNSTLEMIAAAEEIISNMPDKYKATDEYHNFILNCPFLPTTNVYGSENKTETYDILINKILSNSGTVKQYYTPMSYYPANHKTPPEFIYSRSKFFYRDGKKLN